jgi:hypothetical protein
MRSDEEMRAAGWRHVRDCLPYCRKRKPFPPDGGMGGFVMADAHYERSPDVLVSDGDEVCVKALGVIIGTMCDDARTNVADPVWLSGGRDILSFPWWRPLDVLFNPRSPTS